MCPEQPGPPDATTYDVPTVSLIILDEKSCIRFNNIDQWKTKWPLWVWLGHKGQLMTKDMVSSNAAEFRAAKLKPVQTWNQNIYSL